jgi:hypothetical protein
LQADEVFLYKHLPQLLLFTHQPKSGCAVKRFKGGEMKIIMKIHKNGFGN